jgi:hypothetical protein
MHMSVQPHRRLDELVLEVLASYQLQPAPAARQDDLSIEIVFDDESECDIAVTNQFVRMSMPYERVELDLEPAPSALPRRRRPTTFVHTIPARPTVRDLLAEPQPAAETQAFDAVWFDRSEDSLSQMEAAAPIPVRARSWVWLAISLVAAGVATVLFA